MVIKKKKKKKKGLTPNEGGSVESSIFTRKLFDQGAFTVDQYSTSNEITRFNNFRTVDPGDFVWAGESYDHFIPRRITSKALKRLANNSLLLENLGSVMLEIFRVALPFNGTRSNREAQKMVS